MIDIYSILLSMFASLGNPILSYHKYRKVQYYLDLSFYLYFVLQQALRFSSPDFIILPQSLHLQRLLTIWCRVLSKLILSPQIFSMNTKFLCSHFLILIVQPNNCIVIFVPFRMPVRIISFYPRSILQLSYTTLELHQLLQF